jgi:hypothetical protein
VRQLVLEPRITPATVRGACGTGRACHARWTSVIARPGLHITLCDGFRGHTVTITVNGHEVYRRSGVTTAFRSAADTVEVETASDVVHVAVSATPGPFHGSLDIDLSAHPHLAISLVGDGTVSFEPSARPFYNRWPI